jgi:6-phosphogluconolactonase
MIRVYSDAEALSRAAADQVLLIGRSAVTERRRFHLALAGGRTPNAAYAILAREDRGDRRLWDQTHFYWGDERCVPPDHPASNFRAARLALLDALGLRPDQIHRIEGEAADPRAAADRYTALFPAQPDLVILGMGEDGHTASLFPDSPALDVSEPGFTVSEAPVEPKRRITITPPALAAALSVVVLVAGAVKAEALARVFNREGTIYETPARLVRDRLWLVDRAAARALIESGASLADTV